MLDGLCPREHAAELAGDQVEKGASGRVKRQPRADPEEHQPREPSARRVEERFDHRQPRQIGPERRRQGQACVCEVGGLLRAPALEDGRQRKGRRIFILPDRHGARKTRGRLGLAGPGFQRGRRFVRVHHVNPRERNAPRVLRQDIRRFLTDRIDAPAHRGFRAELAQSFETARADHLIRDLGARTEHALHGAPIGGENRPVGKAHMHFLTRQVAREKEGLAVRPSGAPGRVHALQHRSDGVPDLGPALDPRLAEHAWMLLFAQEGDVRVVVEHVHLRSPPEQDRKARRETRGSGRRAGSPARCRSAPDRSLPSRNDACARPFRSRRETGVRIPAAVDTTQPSRIPRPRFANRFSCGDGRIPRRLLTPLILDQSPAPTTHSP